jgi:transcriptional regulator with XRE-family HTH domain
MSVGKNIKNICAKLGINGRELAQLSKIPPTTIYSILSDKADPTASTLKKIIITLGVSADMVLFDDDEQTKNTDVKTLAREIERFEGAEREQAKEMMKALIIHHKSKELMRNN